METELNGARRVSLTHLSCDQLSGRIRRPNYVQLRDLCGRVCSERHASAGTATVLLRSSRGAQKSIGLQSGGKTIQTDQFLLLLDQICQVRVGRWRLERDVAEAAGAERSFVRLAFCCGGGCGCGLQSGDCRSYSGEGA
jgi:hypothetical protein